MPRAAVVAPDSPDEEYCRTISTSDGRRGRASLLAALACAFLALSVAHLEWLAGSAAALFGVVALNRKLYAFFLRQRGILICGSMYSAPPALLPL